MIDTKTSKELNVKALIFDMDGTMFDNMMIHHRAWQKKLKELGLEMTLEEVKRDIHGVNGEIIKRLFGDKFSAEEIKQIAWDKEAAYRAIYAGKIQLLPGLQEFLNQAKLLNIPMGIGTAAPKENAFFAIEALQLESYFKAVVHSDLVDRGKPDPQVFEMAAEQLQVNLQECLVFEDSPTGALAAANGKAKSIILTTTHKKSEFATIKGIQHFRTDYKNLRILKQQDGSFVVKY